MGLIISPYIDFPEPPEDPKQIKEWAKRLYKTLDAAFQRVVFRTEEMTMQGLFADRPDATGKRRFYFATDTHQLFYDDGTWNLI